MLGLEQNLRAVQAKIPPGVKLVAVTKTHPVSVIEQAIKMGVRAIGENRVEEAEKKLPLIRLPVERHMVGHIQSKKAKLAVKLFDVAHSVDSLKLAKKLGFQALEQGKAQFPVLIEVNVSGEGSKYGVSPEELPALVGEMRALEGIDLRGLMAMAPHIEPEETRAYFRRLRELAEQHGLKELSMGMTNDYEVAIEEGATIVRIGTAIFGSRSQ
jgi:pyridoxal phosphate enzyme (YggS family)